MPHRLLRFLLLSVLALCVGCASLLTLPTTGAQGDRDTSAPSGLHGLVLDLNGAPAPNVAVEGHLISNNGSGLISNNGASIISNNGASYRVASAELKTRTDDQGRFVLNPPAGQELNIEAVLSNDVKAIQQGIPSNASEVRLHLAPTGTIRGRVKAPAGVSDMLGISVFIPGTGYIAMTDKDGNYEIPYVPFGRFTLAAVDPDRGRGFVNGVAVLPKQVTEAPEIALALTVPVIASISPRYGLPGEVIEVRGTHFGVSEGKQPELTIGGVQATILERSDTLIKATIPEVTAGEVVVKTNGVVSNGKPFDTWIFIEVYPDYWAEAAPDQLGDPAAFTPNMDYLAVGVSRTYGARVHASDETMVLNPEGLTWQVVSKGGQASIEPGGALRGVALGELRLEASLRSLVSWMFEVTIVEPVTAYGEDVELELSYSALSAGRNVFEELIAVFASGDEFGIPGIWSGTYPGMTLGYYLGDPVAVLTPDTPAGTVSFTVRCVADPSKTATVNATIVN